MKNIDWSKFEEIRGVEEKWNTLLEFYNYGVRKFEPKLKESCNGEKDWFKKR